MLTADTSGKPASCCTQKNAENNKNKGLRLTASLTDAHGRLFLIRHLSSPITVDFVDMRSNLLLSIPVPSATGNGLEIMSSITLISDTHLIIS